MIKDNLSQGTEFMDDFYVDMYFGTQQSKLTLCLMESGPI